MFFVQFQGIELNQLPLMYLARPSHIAAHLKDGRNGNVATCLHVERHFKKGVAKGHTDYIPASWICSLARMNSV